MDISSLLKDRKISGSWLDDIHFNLVILIDKFVFLICGGDDIYELDLYTNYLNF